jgi:hypothetical protein
MTQPAADKKRSLYTPHDDQVRDKTKMKSVGAGDSAKSPILRVSRRSQAKPPYFQLFQTGALRSFLVEAPLY